MAATEAAREPEFSRAYSRYALGLLLVVYVFNFVDRQIVTILMQAIKEDLQLSDAQLGFFSGTAFALFYSTLGIPIARVADRRSRRDIIALALLVWSAMTAFQGAARSFATLAMARIGVGVGEAGCSPPGHSLISDLFPPERRATALSIYALGIPIGSAVGLFLGGWIREWFGWRTAFVVVGLPGVALALLVRLTLREPTRGYWDGAAARARAALPGAAEPLREVARFLARLPAFVHLALAGALHAFYGYGAAFFNPPFFERVHGFSPGELGTLLALVSITSGVAGTFLGGYLTDRMAMRDPRWYAWLPGIATFVAIPFVFVFYLWPHPTQAVFLSLIPGLLGGMYLGPTFAITQSLVPPRWRAQASAVLLLVLNLIGLGLGPQFVGFLSDRLVPAYGVESVRYALLWTVSIGAAWASLHYALGARTLRRDLEAKEAVA